MNDEVLILDNVGKTFSGFELEHISFSVKPNSIMGLIGENGAGKTTIINLILNEIKKTHGNIYLWGKDHIKHEMLIKENLGVVFDDFHFPELLTSYEIGQFMKHIYSHWDSKTYQSFLDQFKLPKNKAVKEFSREMKVKTSLAVALSHGAHFLILDEATSGLDPIMRNEVLGILKHFVSTDQNSILLSSHITDDLNQIADEITFIHKGKLVFTKSKNELSKAGTIDDVMLKYVNGGRKDEWIDS